MTRSAVDKAIAALTADRVRVLKASGAGIALQVASSRPDPATLERSTYRTLVWIHDGELHRWCSCPATRGCYHLKLAELLWRPDSAHALTLERSEPP